MLSGVRFLGETGGAATALRTVTTLLWFWALDGNREEALAWLRFALSAEGEADPFDRLLAQAIVAWSDPDEQPVDPHEAVKQASEMLDGVDFTGRPLLAIVAAIVAFVGGDQERGNAMLDELDGSEDPWLRAMAPFARGQISENLGELEEMRGHIGVAIERFRVRRRPLGSGGVALRARVAVHGRRRSRRGARLRSWRASGCSPSWGPARRAA